jgi:hypothetical protein
MELVGVLLDADLGIELGGPFTVEVSSQGGHGTESESQQSQSDFTNHGDNPS